MENTLQKLSYGQYIITSVKEGEEMTTRDKDFIAAGTVNWAMQSSFEPPMITLALDNQSDLQETIGKSRKFTLHILGSGQKELITDFAKDSKVENDTINGIKYHKDENHQIILEDSIGYISCEVKDVISEGDHSLCVSTVINHELFSEESEPLTTEKVDIQYSR